VCIVELCCSSMVKVKAGAKVITIEPVLWFFLCSKNSRFFCSTNRAGESCCAQEEVDKLVMNCLTQRLTMAETKVPLGKQKRLSDAILSDRVASSRNSGRNGALSVVLRFILSVLLIRGTRARSGGAVQNLNR